MGFRLAASTLLAEAKLPSLISDHIALPAGEVVFVAGLCCTGGVVIFAA
jgi:hypothetical protein